MYSTNLIEQSLFVTQQEHPKGQTGGWPSVGLALELTEEFMILRSCRTTLADPSPARSALRYEFDGGMFDAGVEGGEFHAFAGRAGVGPRH